MKRESGSYQFTITSGAAIETKQCVDGTVFAATAAAATTHLVGNTSMEV
tara:strand:- start:1 stop:147 length:147 start_codon:yes stop_codon:yes gene_type:complete